MDIYLTQQKIGILNDTLNFDILINVKIFPLKLLFRFKLILCNNNSNIYMLKKTFFTSEIDLKIFKKSSGCFYIFTIY